MNPTPLLPRAAWPLGLTLVLALLAGTLYGLRPLLRPIAVASAPVNTTCDLHQGACSSALPGGGRISLSIAPREIRPMTPLELEVRLEGVEASAVSIDFVGVSMDMGLNRAGLRQTAPGRFTGQGMLPVCVRRRMIWDGRVLAETPRGRLAAAFRFETRRP